MSWWAEVRRAAAHEFGRRHYRGVTAWMVARRVIPAILVGGGAAVVAWAAWRFYQAWATYSRAAVPAVVVLAVAASAMWVWRRWGDIIGGLLELALPVEHVGAWALLAVLVVVGGGFTVVWLLVT